MNWIKLIAIKVNGEEYGVDIFKVDGMYDLFYTGEYIQTVSTIDHKEIKQELENFMQLTQ